MDKHRHGSMDIETQEKTFNGFVKLAVRTVVGIAIVLILLAIING